MMALIAKLIWYVQRFSPLLLVVPASRLQNKLPDSVMTTQIHVFLLSALHYSYFTAAVARNYNYILLPFISKLFMHCHFPINHRSVSFKHRLSRPPSLSLISFARLVFRYPLARPYNFCWRRKSVNIQKGNPKRITMNSCCRRTHSP